MFTETERIIFYPDYATLLGLSSTFNHNDFENGIDIIGMFYGKS